MRKLKPVRPGELLREEFLIPMGLTQYRLAKEIGVPAQRIGDIVAGKRAITADTDLRLCRLFGLSNGYWLRAQAAYDTEVTEEALAKTLAKIKPWVRVRADACGGFCRGLRGDGPLSDVNYGGAHGPRGLPRQEGRRNGPNSRPRLRGRPDVQREAGSQLRPQCHLRQDRSEEHTSE